LFALFSGNSKLYTLLAPRATAAPIRNAIHEITPVNVQFAENLVQAVRRHSSIESSNISMGIITNRTHNSIHPLDNELVLMSCHGNLPNWIQSKEKWSDHQNENSEFSQQYNQCNLGFLRYWMDLKENEVSKSV
jgi:hypothetical protein